MNNEKIDINEWYPVIVVLVVFLVSLVATSASGLSSRQSNKTLYNQVVGQSPYEPPGWVFGIIWAIIFIGYTVLWITANMQLKGNIHKYVWINWLLAIGMLLNLAWSFVIAFGASGKISPATAHYASIPILIMIGFYNLFLINAVKSSFDKHTNLSKWSKNILVGVLIVYTIWAFIASFLSVTSPVNSK